MLKPDFCTLMETQPLADVLRFAAAQATLDAEHAEAAPDTFRDTEPAPPPCMETLRSMKDLTSLGRSDLIALLRVTETERDAYLENLTNVQARCTELLIEVRNIRSGGRIAPASPCPAPEAFAH